MADVSGFSVHAGRDHWLGLLDGSGVAHWLDLDVSKPLLHHLLQAGIVELLGVTLPLDILNLSFRDLNIRNFIKNSRFLKISSP
jgi:hypothetical protein